MTGTTVEVRLCPDPDELCRRVAAATGNPPSVNDDIIEIDLPSDSPGFGSSSPMHTNIKIGRVTGRILSGKLVPCSQSTFRALTSMFLSPSAVRKGASQ